MKSNKLPWKVLYLSVAHFFWDFLLKTSFQISASPTESFEKIPTLLFFFYFYNCIFENLPHFRLLFGEQPLVTVFEKVP